MYQTSERQQDLPLTFSHGSSIPPRFCRPRLVQYCFWCSHPDGVNEEGAEIPTASWMYQTPRFSKQKRV